MIDAACALNVDLARHLHRVIVAVSRPRSGRPSGSVSCLRERLAEPAAAAGTGTLSHLLLHRLRQPCARPCARHRTRALRVDGAVGVALADLLSASLMASPARPEVVHIALALTLLARLTLLVLAETAVLELFEQFVEERSRKACWLCRKSPIESPCWPCWPCYPYDPFALVCLAVRARRRAGAADSRSLKAARVVDLFRRQNRCRRRRRRRKSVPAPSKARPSTAPKRGKRKRRHPNRITGRHRFEAAGTADDRQPGRGLTRSCIPKRERGGESSQDRQEQIKFSK